MWISYLYITLLACFIFWDTLSLCSINFCAPTFCVLHFVLSHFLCVKLFFMLNFPCGVYFVLANQLKSVLSIYWQIVELYHKVVNEKYFLNNFICMLSPSSEFSLGVYISKLTTKIGLSLTSYSSDHTNSDKWQNCFIWSNTQHPRWQIIFNDHDHVHVSNVNEL